VTEQVHLVKDQQQEEGWVIAPVMIILGLIIRVRIGEEDMEDDSMVALVMVGEAVLDSGMAMEIITMEMSLMYLKRL
jgi:hypothetical protein